MQGDSCVACANGQYDDDDDARTPCVECPVGKYLDNSDFGGTAVLAYEYSYEYLGCFKDAGHLRDFGRNLPNGGADEGHYNVFSPFGPPMADVWPEGDVPVIPSMSDLADGVGTGLCAEYCGRLGYIYIGLGWTDQCWW